MDDNQIPEFDGDGHVVLDASLKVNLTPYFSMSFAGINMLENSFEPMYSTSI